MGSGTEQFESLCGLPRRTRPEWAIGGGEASFSFDIQLLGDRLVLARAAGSADLGNAERTLALSTAVVDSEIPSHLTYVTVLDFGGLRGATRQARSHFIRRITDRPRMIGLIFCELQPLVGMMVGLGARLGFLKGRLFAVRSLEDAVALGQELLGPDAGKGSPRAAAAELDVASHVARVSQLTARTHRDSSWRRDLDGFSIRYQILDGRILHSRATGFLRREYVQELDDLRLEVVQELGGARGFDYVVADLGGTTGAARRARRDYLASLEAWHAKWPLKGYIAYGAKGIVAAATHLARLTLPFPVRTAADLHDALELVDELEGRSARRRRAPSLSSRVKWRTDRDGTERQVDDILQFISSIRWDSEGAPDAAPVSPEHPLAQVFDAIRLIKWELDELASERRVALDAVHRGSMQRRALVEHIPDAVVLLDSRGAILLENEAARRLLPSLQKTDDLGRVVAVAGLALSQLDAPSGVPRWHEVTLGGSPQRVLELAGVALEEGSRVVIAREVTEERETQRQLAQQERLAAVGQLAAGIAHDFNNLLQVITSSAELLQDRLDRETSHELIQTIRTHCERGGALIRQILDFSRRSISKQARIDLGRVVEESIALLVRTLPESVTIANESAEGPFPLLGDPAQLQQVLTNLSLNARDAMPEGGRLTFSCSHRIVSSPSEAPIPGMAPGPWLELRVADTGVGIPEGNLEHLFEPFFTTKQPGAGTGLGLSQVYGIVRQHGGFVRCANRARGGALFTLFLPAVPDPVELDEAEQAARVDFGSGQTILLVEDDVAVMQVTRRTLESLGYRVLDAPNGARALELLDTYEGAVDLVVSDIVMPEMGGFQLLERLRERSPATRMLLMSGFPLGEMRSRRDLGAGVAWLGKPFTRAELSRTVAGLLAEPA